LSGGINFANYITIHAVWPEFLIWLNADECGGWVTIDQEAAEIPSSQELLDYF
jgi:hypothetical protein